MFWPTFSCFIASLVLSTWAFPTEHQDGKESEGIKKKGDIWAVLVAGSDGWGNYRHQADVCHAWQILTAHGVKPENIITMMYDDIANNTWNKYPGKIFNSPNGIDVYGGVKIDYRGEEVNVGNLKAVLLGNETATNGKPVLKSSNNDKVFVYYTDHGGPGVLGMPTSPSLYLKDVTETLEEMHANEMYKEMTFYLEACHSGSMFETEFLKKLNIYAVSASNAHESSWGYYCPGDCKECEKWADTCLGDLFSINWLEDSDKPDLRRETLTTQFGIVKNKTAATNTTYGSEVLAFGRLQIQQQYVSEFLGRKRARKQGSEGDVTFAAQIPESAQFSAYKAGDIPLMMLAQREEKGDKAAGEELRLLQKKRDYFDVEMGKLVERVLVQGKFSPEERRQILDVHPERITQLDCHKQVMEAFSEKCFDFGRSPYAMAHSHALVNLCEMKISAGQIELAISQHCSATNSMAYTDIL